jgi:hypothetical protein
MAYTPEMILERWIEYVNKADLEKVVRLYDEEGTLLPTFSPHSLSTSPQITEYFMQLSTKKNLVVKLHDKTVRRHEVGEGRYVLMGTYSFSYVVDGANLTFPSRFTFVVDVSRESPILHHHSSQVPRALS